MKRVYRRMFLLVAMGIAVLVAGCGGAGENTASSGATGAAVHGGGTDSVAVTKEDAGVAVVAKEDIDGEITGEMTGLVDGEPFAIYTMISDIGDDEPLNSASWRHRGDGYAVDIVAYRQRQTDRRGAVMLTLRFDGEFDLVTSDSRITYLESAFNVFELPDGSVRVTSVQRAEDDTLKVIGTFGGMGTDEMSGATKEISDGEFEIDVIVRHEWF